MSDLTRLETLENFPNVEFDYSNKQAIYAEDIHYIANNLGGGGGVAFNPYYTDRYYGSPFFQGMGDINFTYPTGEIYLIPFYVYENHSFNRITMEKYNSSAAIGLRLGIWNAETEDLILGSDEITANTSGAYSYDFEEDLELETDLAYYLGFTVASNFGGSAYLDTSSSNGIFGMTNIVSNTTISNMLVDSHTYGALGNLSGSQAPSTSPPPRIYLRAV